VNLEIYVALSESPCARAQMSLSTFLLGKHQTKGGKNIDGDLDSLFRSSVRLSKLWLSEALIIGLQQVSTLPTSLSATPVPQKAGSKRRRGIGNGPLPIKRKKSSEAIDQSFTSKPATAEPIAKDSKKVKKQRRISEDSKTRGKTKDASEGSDEEEADGGLEEAYERKNRRPGKQGSPSTSKNKEGPESASNSEADASQLVHETVANRDQHRKTRPTRKRIHHESPPDETKEQRDARTIFIGNVPVEVAKNKVCPSLFLFHTLTRVGLTYTRSLL
jgi:nucleolar protein 12